MIFNLLPCPSLRPLLFGKLRAEGLSNGISLVRHSSFYSLTWILHTSYGGSESRRRRVNKRE